MYVGQSKLGVINSEEDNSKILTTQPSQQWKDLSIETFNLSPKSSGINSPRKDFSLEDA